MECGIKYCYVRNARHQFHAGIDSRQVCRIVQRTKVSALLDNFDYFVIDDNRVCDLHSAVQNAVEPEAAAQGHGLARLQRLIDEICSRFPNKTIWLYTGYDWEAVCDLPLIRKVDVVVDGQ